MNGFFFWFWLGPGDGEKCLEVPREQKFYTYYGKLVDFHRTQMKMGEEGRWI